MAILVTVVVEARKVADRVGGQLMAARLDDQNCNTRLTRAWREAGMCRRENASRQTLIAPTSHFSPRSYAAGGRLLPQYYLAAPCATLQRTGISF